MPNHIGPWNSGLHSLRDAQSSAGSFGDDEEGVRLGQPPWAKGVESSSDLGLVQDHGLHARAMSESLSVLRASDPAQSRPRSTSDGPNATRTGKLKSMVPTWCLSDAIGDNPRSSYTGARRARYPMNGAAGLTKQDSIAESPEIRSGMFEDQHSFADVSLPRNGKEQSYGSLCGDNQGHEPSKPHVLGLGSPQKRCGQEQSPLAIGNMPTPTNLLNPVCLDTDWSGYTARQLTDMIKSGAMESFLVRKGSPEAGLTTQRYSSQHVNADDVGKPGGFQIHDLTNLALANLPLEVVGSGTMPSTSGVIRIRDIPYNTLKAEVVAFLGRNAKLVEQPTGTPYFAVHVIMERQTAKSMDCFAELQSYQDACYMVERFSRSKMGGKRPRIGERAVTVEISSQQALMAELFPRAKCVTWSGQQPIISQPSDQFSSGFSGFITNEELTLTTKYAENPGRSRFASKHPQRTYESMITLLAKYPWWMTNLITLQERDSIFNATLGMVKILRLQLQRDIAVAPLGPMVLEELAIAGIRCPGFSEPQRAAIIDAWGDSTDRVPFVSGLAPSWPFQSLRCKENVPESFLTHFVNALKISMEARASLHEHEFSAKVRSEPLSDEVLPSRDYSASHLSVFRSYKDDATLAQVAEAEAHNLFCLLNGGA